ncbi:MAG: methyltransferase domain-containing protein [Alphaproteobacteria bacterium]|nr:methyltransferase domain-containing protein [Alphaproteobacteria bacterium]
MAIQDIYIVENNNEGERLENKVLPKQLVDDFFPSYMPRNSIIVDLGCGPGNITSAIEEKFQCKVIGLDNSAERINHARTKFTSQNIDFLHGNVYSLPFDDEKIDLVFSRFLLEHLREPLKAIAEMFRIIKPGGTILIQEIDYQYQGNYPEIGWPQEDVSSLLTLLRKSTGFDGNIGRKLYSYLFQAGFKDIDVSISGYNVFAGSISNNDLYQKTLEFQAIESNLKQMDLLQGEIASMKEKVLKYFLKEDSLSFSLLFHVKATKPF